MDCAGKHRKLGVHISFVRSLNLDSWNTKYILYMENGGNDKFLQYLKQNPGISQQNIDYSSNFIEKYKLQLEKKVVIPNKYNFISYILKKIKLGRTAVKVT